MKGDNMPAPIKGEKVAKFPWGPLGGSIVFLPLAVFLFWANADPEIIVGWLWLGMVSFAAFSSIVGFIGGLIQWSSHEVRVVYQCPYCRSEIQLEATSCKKCGSEISAGETSADSKEASSMDLVTCSNCGKQYSKDENFCKYCGSQRALGVNQ